MIINFNRKVLTACYISAELRDYKLRSSSSGGSVGGLVFAHAQPSSATNNIFQKFNEKWPDNIFQKLKEKWTADDHTVAEPHIGCAAFLKTNHEPQNLPAVNFGSNKDDGNEDAATSMSATTTANAAVTCTSGFADIYPCSNIDLMSFIPLSILGAVVPNPTVEGNDIWGWTHSPTGREFAIMGLTSGTSFVEITDPLNPRYVGFLATRNECSPWRDVKTYADHAFIVSETPGHGMQVYDMTQLLSIDESDMPMNLPETAHYDGWGDAHNIVINEDSGYAYGVGTNTYRGGLHFVDISDPTNPVAAGGYDGDGYTHDAQCVMYDGPDTTYTGSEICFAYNEDTLTIVDVSTKSNPIELASIGYMGSAYTHQGWLTEDWTHVVVNDEVDENGGGSTKTHVFNVEDLNSPTYVGFHFGTTTARDHNLYIKGDLVFEANYRGGLQVLQIVDLATASFTQVANFDIYPASNSNAYNGAWSNYPYFPSGTIIVSGIEQGLYVLQSPNNFGLGGSVRKRKLANDDIHQPEEEPTAEEKHRSLQQAGCIVHDFEAATPGGTDGWTTDGTCTTGTFVVGTPSQQINSCVLTQPGGDHTTGSGQCLYSASNTGPGTNDIDGGECIAISPVYSIVKESNLQVWYFYGHRTTGNDAGDYFALEISIDAGPWTTMAAIGDETSHAIWRDAEKTVPAGSNVQLRIRASDGTANGDLVEAGIDDIVFCPTGTSAPTAPLPPAPSKEPSASPTKDPTNSPTKKPSNSPTKVPTGSPTKGPTGSPTKNPSLSPTSAPTMSPLPPTLPPTKDPTSSPTKEPSNSPTKVPTGSPTKKPTTSPTKEPTNSPTKKPSGSPTNEPTSSPTKEATGSPTLAPTSNPTPPPTNAPVDPVDKYICKKNAPSEEEICLNGSIFPDNTCSTANVPCGNGGKVCTVTSCPGDGSTPLPPPPSPPTTAPPTGQCAGTGESCQFTSCCTGLSCPGGKPSSRTCS